jgi:hypothetical protein
MIRKYVSYLVVFSMALILAACGRSGSEYLGKWQDSVNPDRGTIEISRNGDNYLVKITTVGFRGKQNLATVPAVAKNGLLEIPAGAMGGVTLTYVKDSDALLVSGGLGGNSEMKRVK